MFMSDKETFKLLLFFHGKGCNPEIISRWILLALSWASSQATAEKSARDNPERTIGITLYPARPHEKII